ncbi:uncharacterized protein KY384_003536 [Bacidia gigantensis]|uniref:uncharacterized protein n=1 Tax=Bacidia gigantensis TaxID=2732470 RepID=UPI001D04C1F2|nr:uncharacterized protein KY384_003536 [Bacidia gigantensis]KAG8531900.1 hypothetical protein KY384_003536 [Bacidia gigantensis]
MKLHTRLRQWRDKVGQVTALAKVHKTVNERPRPGNIYLQPNKPLAIPPPTVSRIEKWILECRESDIIEMKIRREARKPRHTPPPQPSREGVHSQKTQEPSLDGLGILGVCFTLFLLLNVILSFLKFASVVCGLWVLYKMLKDEFCWLSRPIPPTAQSLFDVNDDFYDGEDSLDDDDFL